MFNGCAFNRQAFLIDDQCSELLVRAEIIRLRSRILRTVALESSL